eukprot:CAMPEP_0170470538 /NCGR_PEP_ID=MMETSP0123-20130129/12969_1 /TAXON_ID=182087 /ORGANISM="Favella ehrenbergii, Strain Fehren 1" /LENGTH=55 /DNA_ID=CAMNT_0010737709 /DNA_START=260 /DNA_END=424 /DNA_ORIENTATION=-
MEELPFDDQLKYTFDTGCWLGKFTDNELAVRRKSIVCTNGQGGLDVDCIKKGSNW